MVSGSLVWKLSVCLLPRVSPSRGRKGRNLRPWTCELCPLPLSRIKHNVEGPRRVPRGAIKRLLRRGYASKFTGIYSPPISSRTGYVARARVCLTLYESHPTITGRKGERSIAFTKDYLSVMAVRCLMCPVCGRIRAVFSLPITFYGHRYVAARSSRRWKKGWVFFPGPGMHAVTVNASLARAFLSGKLPPAPPPPPPSPPPIPRSLSLAVLAPCLFSTPACNCFSARSGSGDESEEFFALPFRCKIPFCNSFFCKRHTPNETGDATAIEADRTTINEGA